MLTPLINSFRLVKIVLSTHTFNIKDINTLHGIWLQQRCQTINSQRSFEARYASALSANSDTREYYRKHEYSIFSQHGEDGLIAFIFEQIGVGARYFVEFGAGGKTSNTELLAQNFGWGGLIIDGSKKQLAATVSRYIEGGVDISKITTLENWITKENIDDLLKENCAVNEIDIISIDIDGNDYWIWEALQALNPRLVVIEYNASLGSKDSITIGYNPAFNRMDHHPLGWYHGASLKSLEKLAAKKGYSLICCESSGVNAFFVRDDLLNENTPVMSAEDAFYHDQYRSTICSASKQREEMEKFDFVNV